VINAGIHRLGQLFLALWTLSSASLSLSLSHSPDIFSFFQFGDLPIWISTKPHIYATEHCLLAAAADT